ncbi:MULTISPECIES: ATP-binding cassette domain-containing protein [Campylobacter]|uniref:ATP-binding cassette domain-containing protein n=1 Tax=Campylobacter porcelli TaxID=1660073 RepID=A0A1X9SUT4_9BACT|nr:MULTISPECIES: ATP-binding cassette domain-containing protein [unclassified Campylobacter]MCR8678836.1 ATP-binding cassette domain-containing protein [Campylobacter sp. RM19072]MCR8695967.1 ATP-binding cassette domain-containing protein [Campylobacter sp. RM19073]MEE3704863.1 ATP-binding cassette domain-containing protein [Campylobacter sp. CX2-8023-23]MEE3744141.1 ATP-binding cassette domain-containing protein [Campylobacter sp. CX2-4855-23]MEE3776886.1 ATP-binding cassette domain-containin
MSILRVENLSYYIAQKPIIKDFSLSLNLGQIVTLFGPSGCGKSTFLRLISSILKPKDGIINHSGKISYIFQEHRLFDSLSVYENIALVMKRADPKWIYDNLSDLGLSKIDAKKYPNELSGGMRARVAFIRALAYNGDLILLDEPFSGIDFTMRQILMEKLNSAIKSNNKAAILVTHDAYEACKLSDIIIFLSQTQMQIEKTLKINQKNRDEKFIKELFNSEFKGRIYFD